MTMTVRNALTVSVVFGLCAGSTACDARPDLDQTPNVVALAAAPATNLDTSAGNSSDVAPPAPPRYVAEACNSKDDLFNCVGRSLEEQPLAAKVLCYWEFYPCFWATVLDCAIAGCPWSLGSRDVAPTAEATPPDPLMTAPMSVNGTSYSFTAAAPGVIIPDPSAPVSVTAPGFVEDSSGAGMEALSFRDPTTGAVLGEIDLSTTAGTPVPIDSTTSKGQPAGTSSTSPLFKSPSGQAKRFLPAL